MRLPFFALLLAGALAGAAPDRPRLPVYESDADLAPRGKIDELVFARLKRLGIQPSYVCSDAVFLRRAFLDVIGTLPTPEEASQFLADRDPAKRTALIDRLLEREEFADYWAMKWSDLLRIKAEFPINLWPNAAQAYHRWIRASLRENKPYDRFVRELLTESGSNFRVPQVNFYRAMQSREPQAVAQAVALAFMGARAEKWPKERLAGMAAFFNQIAYKYTGEWKEEIVFFDPSKPAGAAARQFPDGTRPAATAAGRDPREVFADWLIAPKNPWFARSIVNRAWSWLVGRGIVHEPDDIRPDNPPVNPELLAYLEQELVTARYDLKHVFRLILNSKTYQLSSIPRTDQRRSRRQLRLLPAAAPRCRGPHRRPLPDHRHHRTVHQRDSRALHLHPRRPALHQPAGRQHHEFVPGIVRAPAARHRPRGRAQQPSRGGPAPAPAQLDPCAAQNRARPQAAATAQGQPEPAGDGERDLPRHSFAPAGRRRVESHGRLFAVGRGERTRGRGRPRLGPHQQRGVSLPPLTKGEPKR